MPAPGLGVCTVVRFARPGWEVMALYVPMLLWGPLLIVVALDYRRRRRLSWLPSPAR